MKRGLTVLKMRGSWHDKAIREFTIGKGGMTMGRAFRNVTGILAGAPVHVSPADLERVWGHMDAEASGVPTDDIAARRKVEERRSGQ